MGLPPSFLRSWEHKSIDLCLDMASILDDDAKRAQLKKICDLFSEFDTGFAICDYPSGLIKRKDLWQIMTKLNSNGDEDFEDMTDQMVSEFGDYGHVFDTSEEVELHLLKYDQFLDRNLLMILEKMV